MPVLWGLAVFSPCRPEMQRDFSLCCSALLRAAVWKLARKRTEHPVRKILKHREERQNSSQAMGIWRAAVGLHPCSTAALVIRICAQKMVVCAQKIVFLPCAEVILK